MGKLYGSFFGRTHTASTGTSVMAHFPCVVFHLEPPVTPMVHRPIPPHHYFPDLQQALE